MLSLVKAAGNAFPEECAIELLPCVRGVKSVDPLSPVIVLREAWRGDTLADRTDVLRENQDPAVDSRKLAH